MPEIRPLTPDDAREVFHLTTECFQDLARRRGRPPEPARDYEASAVRLRHSPTADPDGCWAACEDGRIVAATMASIREGVWGLSLLVVAPHAQSSGIGRELMRRALEYGAPHRGGLILSSDDPRAIRTYARAGFTLRPTVMAHGRPREIDHPAGVRTGSRDDVALTEDVDRRVRGAARGQDIHALLDAGSELLVHPGRGYAVRTGGSLRTLAALDDEAARDLLRATIARAPRDSDVEVEFVTAEQEWAIGVLLDAGLDIEPYGPMFTRGETGTLRPYLPNGAYL